MVFANLWFALNCVLQLALVVEEPSEGGILDLLIVLLVKEFIAKELH